MSKTDTKQPAKRFQAWMSAEVGERLRTFINHGTAGQRVCVLLDAWDLLTPEQKSAVLEKPREVVA